MPAGLGGVLAKRASREVKMEVRTNKQYENKLTKNIRQTNI